MLGAFKALDEKLKVPAKIIIGGGAAMILAHDIPLSTMDIDGLLVSSAIEPAELDPLVKKVAQELKINPHWFNSYFGTFTYTIPADYEKRLIDVFGGKNLKVSAFGIEDLLIMKCFSGREKDIGHARALALKCKNLKFVDDHIQGLADKGLPGSKEALDFFDDVRDRIGK